LEPWQYYQRGWALRNEWDPESHRQAQEMFKRALDLDPAFTPAMAALARTYHDDHTFFHIAEDSIARCMQEARRAIELDNLDSMAHAALSMGALRSRDYHLAVDEGHKAIRLNPGNAFAHIVSGNALSFAGKSMLGVVRISKALALTSPYDPGNSFTMLMVARSHLVAGNHAATLKWTEKSIRLRHDWAFSHFARASALAHLRRWSAAEDAIERCLAIDPGCVDWMFSQTPFADPADHNRILDGVRQLGFG
jgi:adenylate cyclase